MRYDRLSPTCPAMSPRVITAFLDGVGDVVGTGTQEQVRHSSAHSVIASMEYAGIARDAPVFKFPSHSVDKFQLTLDPDDAVPRVAYAASPVPALVSLVHLLPEPINEGSRPFASQRASTFAAMLVQYFNMICSYNRVGHTPPYGGTDVVSGRLRQLPAAMPSSYLHATRRTKACGGILSCIKAASAHFAASRFVDSQRNHILAIVP